MATPTLPKVDLARQELRGFLGVNLRADRLNLTDLELAKAINADLHTQPGSIVLRLGRQPQFAGALADAVVRRIGRFNAHRYQVAGQSVYRDQVKVIDNLLSPNLFTTLFSFRPLNDDTTWVFVADNSGMRKINADSATVSAAAAWGLAAPTTAPTGAIAALGTGLTGAYQAAFTFLRLSGAAVAAESNPSPSVTVALSSQDLALGDVPTPVGPITALGIYRTAGDGATLLLDSRETVPIATGATSSGTAWSVTHDFEVGAATSGLQLHWSIPLGSGQRGSQAWEPTASGASEDVAGYRGTHLWEAAGYVTTQTRRWAYHSSKADTGLGAAATLDNDLPPSASWATEFLGHVFLCRDPANPHYLWFSKRFQPEAVPPGNFIEIGNPDDPLQCALGVAGLLAAFSRRTKYRIIGNSISGFSPVEAISRRGTPAPAAVAATEHGIVFVARDGVWLTNMVQTDQELSETIAPLFYGEDVNGMPHVNWDAALTMAGAMWKGRYYLSLPTGSHSQPDTLAVYSVTTKKWYFYDHPARSLLFEEDTDLLAAGFTDGFVYTLETGSSDASSAVSLDCETKDVFGAAVESRKLFLWARVDLDAAADSVTVELYVDGRLVRTVSVTGTRKRRLIAFPEGSMGYAWRIRFRYSGTARVRIYGAAALSLPLEAA